jgi:hypothetical protein
VIGDAPDDTTDVGESKMLGSEDGALGAWLAGVALAVAGMAGCTTPMVVFDAGGGRDAGMDAAVSLADTGLDAAIDDDAASTPDTGGDDAGAASDASSTTDAGSADAGTAGPTSLHGTIVSLAGASVSGSIVLVDQGFERGGGVCSGTTCVVGGIVP